MIEAFLPPDTTGRRFTFPGQSVAAMILRTGRAARIDRHDETAGPDAEYISKLGLRSGVGAPIIVEGRMLGCGGRRLVEIRTPATKHRGARIRLRGPGRDRSGFLTLSSV